MQRCTRSGPSCRGGASSALRLSQPTLALLPMAHALAQRMKPRTP
ncbi:MAG: hypothetical protein ABI809_04790 [Caldimonas sp.]